MSKDFGTLPDGKPARSNKQRAEAWDAFTLPICQDLGLERIGYDPGLLACLPNNGPSIDLPGWFLRRYNSAHPRKA